MKKLVLDGKPLGHVTDVTDQDGFICWCVPFVGGTQSFYDLNQALEFAVRAITHRNKGQEVKVAWVSENGVWTAYEASPLLERVK